MRAGHELRFLVRNSAALRIHFEMLGLRADDVVQADMQDAAAVRSALAGCDAVVHAAAAVNLDARQAEATLRNNLAGVQSVVGGACELGLRNVVYVSSLSCLFNPELTRITEEAPLAASRNAYTQSKTAAERWVRDLQSQGAPVQISYPAAVLGPQDPKLCESNGGFLTFASKTLPLTRTGFQFVDVRDVAAIHTALIEKFPRGEKSAYRFILGGHYLPWAQLRDALQAATGVKPPAMPLPAALLRTAAALVDTLQKIRPFPAQLSGEAVEFMTRWVMADSARVLAHTGLAFRPAQNTLIDTLTWLAEAGHLPARAAGRLAVSA
jgi:nucleoside-diphosphate-sugar epimerase